MILAAITGGCSGSRPDSVGVHNSRLSDCPGSPNCVSSESTDDRFQVPSLHLADTSGNQWEELIATVKAMPRTSIIVQTDNYLHAECKSRVFRFVDDLELLLNRETGEISIRSASRVGRSDFGVNRKRIDSLRAMLMKEGVIKN